MNNLLNISIVIPTYNKLPRLKLTLASLCKQTISHHNFEVILVDDHSKDQTQTFIQSIKAPFAIHYHRNKKRRGRAYTRNVGIKLAQYDTILFIDDDLVLTPDFIAQHVKLQCQSKRIIHGKIINIPFVRYFIDPSCAKFYTHCIPTKITTRKLMEHCITEKDIFNNFEKKFHLYKKISPLESVIQTLLNTYPKKMDWLAFNGGNISIPKNWLIEVGLFNERFGLTWGCEDLELGYRLQLGNFPFYYAENAINYHLSHDRQDFEKQHQINVDYFYALHPTPLIHIFQNFVTRKINKKQFIHEILLTSKQDRILNNSFNENRK